MNVKKVARVSVEDITFPDDISLIRENFASAFIRDLR